MNLFLAESSLFWTNTGPPQCRLQNVRFSSVPMDKNVLKMTELVSYSSSMASPSTTRTWLRRLLILDERIAVIKKKQGQSI